MNATRDRCGRRRSSRHPARRLHAADADLTAAAVERELLRLQCAPLFRRYRGAPALDRCALAKLVARVGEVRRREPAIREIDLNPVVVNPDAHGVIALDALLLVD